MSYSPLARCTLNRGVLLQKLLCEEKRSEMYRIAIEPPPQPQGPPVEYMLSLLTEQMDLANEPTLPSPPARPLLTEPMSLHDGQVASNPTRTGAAEQPRTPSWGSQSVEAAVPGCSLEVEIQAPPSPRLSVSRPIPPPAVDPRYAELKPPPPTRLPHVLGERQPPDTKHDEQDPETPFDLLSEEPVPPVSPRPRHATLKRASHLRPLDFRPGYPQPPAHGLPDLEAPYPDFLLNQALDTLRTRIGQINRRFEATAKRYERPLIIMQQCPNSCKRRRLNPIASDYARIPIETSYEASLPVWARGGTARSELGQMDCVLGTMDEDQRAEEIKYAMDQLYKRVKLAERGE